MSKLLLPEDLIPDRSLKEGDADAFNHEAIAGRVAEIVLTAPTPTNIALFGAWGSGKSSIFELLRRVLKRSGDPAVALVRYDAWKYGGASLKKNFISHAATELGLDANDPTNREFHRGLYESTRSLDLRFSQFLKGEAGKILKAAVITILVALLVVVALAALVGWLSQRGVWITVSLWVGTWGATVAGGLGTLVAVLKLLDIAKVEVEQTAPSTDEQFSKTFSRLVTEARRRGVRGKYERLVFFIDELDRCSKRDVVETLSALRTFLDVPHCVFIVVADRDVLEEALIQLPQSTPAKEASPYYSTASSFLDKIFQFQISLPPLRTGRLTRYARDLVVERKGLWGELRDGEEERLNEVIYALIPSHVRSPRRVKVLLNRFATNARIAQARGLSWIQRAAEIAKMTVLETEFPLFCDALIVEPRLPEYVLARRAPAPLPEPSASVIRKFVPMKKPTANGNEVDGEGEGALDRVITRSSETRTIHRAQQRQLIRYLERTARVANPGRDLLYLEAAGVWAGLDPAVGQVLEDLAPESPRRALEAVESLTREVQEVAVRFVCGMIEREFGVERKNALDVGLGIAERLEYDLGSAVHPLTKALQAFLREQQLEEHQLDRALHVGLAAEDHDLVRALMSDERVLTEIARVAEVAGHLPLLSQDDRTKVAEEVANCLPSDSMVLLSPLNSLSARDAEWLITEVKEDLVQQVMTIEEAGEVESAAELLQSLLHRSQSKKAARDVIWRLFSAKQSEAAYIAVRESISYFGSLSQRPRNSYALTAIRQGPTSDWPLWNPLVSGDDTGWDQQAARAKRVANRLIGEFPALSEEEVATSALELAAKAAKIAQSADTEAATEIGSTLETALQGRRWWANSELLDQQRLLHLVAARLQLGGGSLSERIVHARTQDLLRSLAGAAQMTADGVVGLIDLSHDLPSSSLISLIERIEEIRDAVPVPLMPDLALSHVELWGRLNRIERENVTSVQPSEVSAAMGDYAPPRLRVLKTWLDTDPTIDDAIEVAMDVPSRAAREVARLYADWATDLDQKERTNFLRGLWSKGQTKPIWIRQMQPLGLDELALTDVLVEGILAAPRAEQREEHIDRLLALSPQDGRAQYRVGDLIVALLKTGLKVDVQLALRAVPALGSGHRSKGRIEDALRSATTELGVKITRVQAGRLKAVGIRPPKRSFTERAWEFLTGN